jgi:replication-associated recombination protein RarA
MKQEAPLAARVRPRILDEYIGQEHIVGEGKLLRRLRHTHVARTVMRCCDPGMIGEQAHIRAINNTVILESYKYGMQRRVKGYMTLSDESIEI